MTLLALHFLLLQVTAVSAEKFLCYTGSSMYELVPTDCAAEDESYGGEWYCSTIEVCERFQESGRQCILSRGCATEEQCTDASNEIYDGTPLLQGAEVAGGMTTTLTCCKAKDYADDDVIALDYGSICNAGSLCAPSAVLYTFVCATMLLLLHS